MRVCVWGGGEGGNCDVRSLQPSEMTDFVKQSIFIMLCFNLDKPAYKTCDMLKRPFVMTRLGENKLLTAIRV